MGAPAPRLSREEEAKLALEHTRISPLVARALSVLFLFTICVVPVLQLISRARQRQRLPLVERGAGLLPGAAELKKFEGALQEDSPVVDYLLPRTQNVLTRLGVGNKKGLVGRGGWLVYKPDVDYLTGRAFLDAPPAHQRDENGEEVAPVQSDAVSAIVSFNEQLARRGIRLILLPTPLKPMLQPEALSSRYPAFTPALQNPSYTRFLAQMAQHKVLVCDPTLALTKARDKMGEPQFLRTDTHWTPEAMQLTGDLVAAEIRRTGRLLERPSARYTRQQVLVSGQGDIAAMLKLPPRQHPFEPQAVAIQRVLGTGGQPWKPARGSDVMLLGDSFTNIFSRPALGWGNHAGLAEQISFSLQRPLDVIAINAGGASTTRARLRDELLRQASNGRDRLSGTRVLVWQFAMRDLQSGDWKMLSLPPRRASSPNASPQPRPTFRPALPFVPRAVDPAVLAAFRSDLATRAARAEAARSQVLEGRPGWMFYLPDVYYVSTQGFLKGNPSPQVQALEDFRRQLAARGITLLVMPIPSKTTIYPDKALVPASGLQAPPSPQNPDFQIFGQALEQRGIRFFDPTNALLEQRRQSNGLLFLPGDSHWSFLGAECAAGRLSEAILRSKDLKLPARPRVAYERRTAVVRNITDISMMLPKLPDNAQFIHAQQTVQQVLTPEGSLWQPDPSADILILGDSFTNIFSRGGYWGRGAGLAEQLSYYLQRPVDRLALDGDGVNGTRLELQHEMQQGHDRLAGKKLVIFEIASRYLLSTKWQLIALPKASPKAARPLSPTAATASPTPSQPTEAAWMTGAIASISPVPEANSTPYADMVMSLLLRDVRVINTDDEKKLAGGDIVVYLWGLRNQVPTPSAHWKVGQRVKLKLRPWPEVEDEFGSYNRSDLPQEQGTAALDEYWADESE